MAASAPDSICKPLIVHTMSFLPKANIKVHAKCQILGRLSAREME